MVALDRDKNPERGRVEATDHTLEHLEIVSKHCYVAEDSDGQVIGAMVLHPRDEVFEVEDFHVRYAKKH